MGMLLTQSKIAGGKTSGIYMKAGTQRCLCLCPVMLEIYEGCSVIAGFFSILGVHFDLFCFLHRLSVVVGFCPVSSLIHLCLWLPSGCFNGAGICEYVECPNNDGNNDDGAIDGYGVD